jgi:8-oxo-dGTP pyrophosphatase MutT (NUDIX family)
MSAGNAGMEPSAGLRREFPKHRGGEQVAAVCYRIGRSGIEFLLVQTRNGRWTFPKGGAEPGLTHAQAAAVEAFEEAGVHGRIEQVAFAQYTRGKQRGSAGVLVHAYLCEVARLVQPQESNRVPTWFSPYKARRRLRENRAPAAGAELAHVVDRAVARIRRLGAGENAVVDPLQKAEFEPLAGVRRYGRLLEAVAGFTDRRRADARRAAAILPPRLSPLRNPRMLPAADEAED